MEVPSVRGDAAIITSVADCLGCGSTKRCVDCHELPTPHCPHNPQKGTVKLAGPPLCGVCGEIAAHDNHGDGDHQFTTLRPRVAAERITRCNIFDKDGNLIHPPLEEPVSPPRRARTLRLEDANADFLKACAERDDGSENYLINMLLASARESGVTSIIDLAIEIRNRN